ncbi:MAG: hypothetical protein AB7S74_13980 [Hyphomicrobium sp.]
MSCHIARMVSLAKWEHSKGIPRNTIPGDAVNDLRSTANALSFWRCDPASTSTMEDVVVALASARPKIEKIDILWFHVKRVKYIGVRLENNLGDTPAGNLNQHHVDVAGLNIDRIVRLARACEAAIKAGQCRVYTKMEVTRLLRTAVDTGVLDLKLLKGELPEKIRAFKVGQKS